LAPLDNLTVAWIKSDSKAILAIHTHMVALNPRLSVTHNGHNTWKLHISHVAWIKSDSKAILAIHTHMVALNPRLSFNDSGSYMCQVNTDPMRHQRKENSNTNYKKLISTFVKLVEGERLVLNQVQRTDMGGYLCIASNGVPPSVSKRFDVQVNCMKLYEGEKYTISEEKLNAYTWQLNLTVENLHKGDFGPHICSSINALGKSDVRIRLQELHLPPKPTTTPTPYVPSTVKQPRRKQHLHGKGGNSFNRDTYVRNHIQENDYLGSLSVHEGKERSHIQSLGKRFLHLTERKVVSMVS
uniref:Uncharacterized protein n=1 Tax=Anopheles atroparvus TaxID=41427 RepID=A0A182IN89_ANOAO